MSKRIKLSAELQAAIDHDLRQLHDMMPDIDAAEQCDMDCQDWKREREKMVTILENFKKHFGD